MMVYNGMKTARKVARDRAREDRTPVLIFQNVNIRVDHIVVPERHAVAVRWPGGRECWTQVARVEPGEK